MKTTNHSDNPSGLSREEISSYLRGDLSPEEMHRVESILESDDFAYEAMEGLEESSKPIQQMDKIAEMYHTKYASPWYELFNWKQLLYPIGGVLIIGTWFFFSPTENKSIAPPIAKEENTQIEKSIVPLKKEDNTPKHTVAYTRPEVTKKPKEKVKPAKKVVRSSEANPSETSSVYTRNLSIVALKEIRYQKLIFDKEVNPIVSISRLDMPYEIFDVAGLEVVNLFYHNMFHNPDELSDGLDASIAHEAHYDPELDKAEGQKQYTYGSYIETALELYKTKKYKESIASLEIILDQYPKDVNAEYYIGLAYYRQNKSEKAIEYLDRAQNNAIAYFHDDAKLYKALSYKKKGDLKTCKRLLQEIIDQNGKNKNTAEEILKHQ